MSWKTEFAFPEELGGVLAVKMNPAKRGSDDKSLLAFELTARGVPHETPLEQIETWFSHAHTCIVRGFEDLTELEAQKELWGKHE